jgi:hypothetical protein
MAVRFSWANPRWLLCEDGNGSFRTHFQTGVSIKVGAAQLGGLASRACSAQLSWGENDDLVVVPSAAQVDLDVAGVGMGIGEPVAAFVVRKDDDDSRAIYALYSVKKPASLLWTLTGGDNYSARDADFDGRISIWTGDAAAISGFDQLTYADFDFAPTVVLAFVHKRLVDVSAEYPKQYDQQIAEVRAQLTPEALAAFRNSDGKLLNGSLPPVELVRLQKAKVKVLEIAWLYLNSGRQDQAWAELTHDWPAADLQRVESLIEAARRKGIDAQVREVESPGHGRHRQRLETYVVEPPGRKSNLALQSEMYSHGMNRGMDPTSGPMNLTDTQPQAILMQRGKLQLNEEDIYLVLDEVGKVQSASMTGPNPDRELLEASKGWRFVPAYKDGHPVACRYRMEVYPPQ